MYFGGVTSLSPPLGPDAMLAQEVAVRASAKALSNNICFLIFLSIFCFLFGLLVLSFLYDHLLSNARSVTLFCFIVPAYFPFSQSEFSCYAFVSIICSCYHHLFTVFLYNVV